MVYVGSGVTVGLLASVLVAGCASGPVAGDELKIPKALSDELCLVQFSTGQLEIATLNGQHRGYWIPGGLDPSKPHLSWGRLSPDGSYVVAGNVNGLVAVTPAGRRLWRVDIELPSTPAFSPDGLSIAFTTAGQLVAYHVPSSDLTKLAVRGRNAEWHPSGTRLAYDDGTNVRIYDLTTKTASDVGKGTEPRWFPDGQSLAVRAGPHKIERIDLRSGERREILRAKFVTVPRSSPDGRWMTFSYLGADHWWTMDVTEPHQLMVRDTKTGAEKSVAVFSKGNSGDFIWVTNREVCSVLRSS